MCYRQVVFGQLPPIAVALQDRGRILSEYREFETCLLFDVGEYIRSSPRVKSQIILPQSMAKPVMF